MAWDDVGCYDYNGAIFIFGAVNSSLTSKWNKVTQVALSVDVSNAYNYKTDLVKIPYTSTNTNNTQQKVFNINTYSHRIRSKTSVYQFSSGDHYCYLQFLDDSDTVLATAEVWANVHATLATPDLSYDEETGKVVVSRSVAKSGTRYYLEIRRANRDLVNRNFTAVEKDYAYMVAMGGTEGGKYNEGIPHTGFLPHGDADIAGSKLLPGLPTSEVDKGLIEPEPKRSATKGISLMSVSPGSASSPNTIALDAWDTTASPSRYTNYYFRVPASAGMYKIYCEPTGGYTHVYSYADANYTSYCRGVTAYEGSNNVCLAQSTGSYVYFYVYTGYSTTSFRVKVVSLPVRTLSDNTAFDLAENEWVLLQLNGTTDWYKTIIAKNPGIRITSPTLNQGYPVPGLNPVTWWATYDKGGEIRFSSPSQHVLIGGSSSANAFYLTPQHSDIDDEARLRTNRDDLSHYVLAIDYDIWVDDSDSTTPDPVMTTIKTQALDSVSGINNALSEIMGTSRTTECLDASPCWLHRSTITEASLKSGLYIDYNDQVVSGGELYYISVSKGEYFVGTGDYGVENNVWFKSSLSTGTPSIPNMIGPGKVSVSAGYLISNDPFRLYKKNTSAAVANRSASTDRFNDVFSAYATIACRVGTAQSTAEVSNGQGHWDTYLYYDASEGVSFSLATIAWDASTANESVEHVIHEELAQSLGVGNDAYSQETSIHWDPQYANPDYYTGIDKKIWQMVFRENYNGYTAIELLNELDTPALLFRDYTEYSSSDRGYVFNLSSPFGGSKLKSGTYDLYAWCVQQVGGSTDIGGSVSEPVATSAQMIQNWDNDVYSLRSEPLRIVIDDDSWYWTDYGIDMANASRKLSVRDVHHTIWNSFVDATARVMKSGTIPNNSTLYGSAAGKGFSEAIERAKCTAEDPTLYAQRFNIVNYIIEESLPSGLSTNINAQNSLTSQVLAEYMSRLEWCRNQI